MPLALDETRSAGTGPLGDSPAVALDLIAKATRVARGPFFADRADDSAARLAAIATADDALVIESPRRAKGPFSRRSFAARLWRAGAREIVILAPGAKAESDTGENHASA